MKRKKETKDYTVWPKNGDAYFWVRSDIGDICMSEWADDVPYHEFRRSIGNVFPTRSSAREAIVRQQARIMDRSAING